jgi:anti-sigma factor RsiW
MNCTYWEDRLLDALDRPGGRLAPDCQAHLETCEACREFLATQRQLDRALAAQLAAPAAPAGFRAAVHRRLGRESRPPWMELVPDVLNALGVAAVVLLLRFLSAEPWTLVAMLVGLVFGTGLLLGRGLLEEQ